MTDQQNDQPAGETTPPQNTSKTSRGRRIKTDGAKNKKRSVNGPKRTRVIRPYPASSFEEALKLAEAIQKIAPGGKLRRLTLCEQMKISPTSSSTKMLITNSLGSTG